MSKGCTIQRQTKDKYSVVNFKQEDLVKFGSLAEPWLVEHSFV